MRRAADRWCCYRAGTAQDVNASHVVVVLFAYGVSVEIGRSDTIMTYNSPYEFRTVTDPAVLYFQPHELHEKFRTRRVRDDRSLNLFSLVKTDGSLGQR